MELRYVVVEAWAEVCGGGGMLRCVAAVLH
jgi:hypothetical protein